MNKREVKGILIGMGEDQVFTDALFNLAKAEYKNEQIKNGSRIIAEKMIQIKNKK